MEIQSGPLLDRIHDLEHDNAGLRETVAGLELKLAAILNEAVLTVNESDETEKDAAGWQKEIRVLALTCGWPGSHSSRHPWGYITLAVQRALTAEATVKAQGERIAELYGDSMIAHRWFAARFGTEMDGRDFSVKCAMASRLLMDERSRLEKLEACVRALVKRQGQHGGLCRSTYGVDSAGVRPSCNCGKAEADAALEALAASAEEKTC